MDFFDVDPGTFEKNPRENERTEREARGVGRDMSCPRKLFLDERKSVFRDVRMQSSTNVKSTSSAIT